MIYQFVYLFLLRVCAYDVYGLGMFMVHVWRSEVNLVASLLSFDVGSEYQTQFLGLRGKPLYLLSHSASPACASLKITCHVYDCHGQLKLEKLKPQILALTLKVPEDSGFLWVPGLLSAVPRSPRTVCAFQQHKPAEGAQQGRRDPIPNSFPITQKDAEAQRGTDTCLR